MDPRKSQTSTATPAEPGGLFCDARASWLSRGKRDVCNMVGSARQYLGTGARAEAAPRQNSRLSQRCLALPSLAISLPIATYLAAKFKQMRSESSPPFRPWELVSPLGRQRNNQLSRRESQMSLVQRFLREETGATAIEYGLIAAGISIVIIAAVNGVGTQLQATFSSISSQLASDNGR